MDLTTLHPHDPYSDRLHPTQVLRGRVKCSLFAPDQAQIFAPSPFCPVNHPQPSTQGHPLMTLPSSRLLTDIPITPPNPEALAQLAHKRLVQLEDSGDDQSIIDTIQAWDHTRRAFETQRLLATIRFAQNTRDEARRADKKAFDDYEPTAQGHEVEFLRELLSSARGCRAAIRAYGHHAVALWRCILLGFEPAIADDKRAEADLITRYNTLRSTLSLVFQGQNHTLSSIRGFYGAADRATRLEAIQAEDTALGTHTETLDALFDDLVKTRHRMAQTLNWPNFITPAYAARRRADWTPTDAQVFRESVLEHIVPLCNQIRARRAQSLVVSDPGFHDEGRARPPRHPQTQRRRRLGRRAHRRSPHRP